MSPLEKKKIEANILRAQSMIAEYEVKKMERMEDIQRMDEQIKMQVSLIEDHKKTLNQGAKNV